MKFKLPKQSLFLKIVLGVFAFYIPHTAGVFLYYSTVVHERELKESLQHTSNYMRIGRILIREGAVADLAARLSDATDTLQIHYYVIRKEGKVVAYGNVAGTDDPIELADNPQEGIYEDPEDEYRQSVILQDGYELWIGHKLGAALYVKALWAQQQQLVLIEISLLLALVAAASLWGSRDLRLALRNIRKRGAKRGDLAGAKSKEVLVLLQGLKGYETNIDALSQENLLLKGLVLPALKREMFSGKAPPYEFGCTLVRTDINNFTAVFSSDKRVEFMQTINDFFIELTHIVSRYGGYVYEFIGDEVLFYFKDEEFDDSLSSSAIAISCLRDIHLAAERVHERTDTPSGYPFRIKTSLSYGMLRFGPLVDGYSLAGVPLIETVRLLSTVHEKSENIALMDEVVRNRIGDLCLVRDHGVVMLKGLPGARRTHVYQAHVPINHHLRQGRSEALKQVTYYRGDLDIAELLAFIRMNRKDLSREDLLILLGTFKQFKVTQGSVNVKSEYLELLESLLTDAASAVSDESAFVLASVIASATHLFPKESFQGRLRERFLECLKVPNNRVVANTLDVFAELDPTAGDEAFASLPMQGDNRIAGNTLVKQAKRDWNRELARRLRSMLRGKNPHFKAAGLYALGEIAQHLKKLDEVAYEADRDLQPLLEEGMALLKHANKMVRRQALRAVEKSGRLKDLEIYVNANRGLLAPDILDESQTLLGAPTVADVAANVVELRARRLG